MKNNILRAGFVMAVAVTATFGLSACGSSDNGSSSSEATSTSQAADDSQKSDSGESEAFVKDLQDGVKLVNDQIAQESGMTQIMLAELCRPTVVLPRPIQIGKPGKKAVREKPGRSPERIGGLRRHRCGFRLQG